LKPVWAAGLRALVGALAAWVCVETGVGDGFAHVWLLAARGVELVGCWVFWVHLRL
jgi:hypothetical protein